MALVSVMTAAAKGLVPVGLAALREPCPSAEIRRIRPRERRLLKGRRHPGSEFREVLAVSDHTNVTLFVILIEDE